MARISKKNKFTIFSSEETKKKMFEMMDKDISGGISKAELAQWIKSTQEMDSEAEDVEEEVVAAEFNRIDSNQDGQLRSVHVVLSKFDLSKLYYSDFAKPHLIQTFVSFVALAG